MSEVPFGRLPAGRRLPGVAPATLFQLHVLRPATGEFLEVARRSWPERDEDEFTWSGRRAIDKGSGERFRISTSFGAFNTPETSGVEAFVVRDSRIVLLVRPDDAPTTVTEIGAVTSRKATGSESMPAWGPQIR